jgi:hypothetical protein
MNPAQYQVLIPTPGCSVGDILTANADGSLTSTDGTVTYQPTAANFASNFGPYDPTTTWKPIPAQTVWTFSFNLSRPPAISVVSMPYDPTSTAFVVLEDSLMIFPTEDAANAALAAMLATLTPLTNTDAQATIATALQKVQQTQVIDIKPQTLQ